MGLRTRIFHISVRETGKTASKMVTRVDEINTAGQFAVSQYTTQHEHKVNLNINFIKYNYDTGLSNDDYPRIINQG